MAQCIPNFLDPIVTLGAVLPRIGQGMSRQQRSRNATPDGRRRQPQIRRYLQEGARALELMRQHQSARALRRLAGDVEGVQRNVFRFLADLGVTPDQQGPDAATPTEPRRETRRERRAREWRLRRQRNRAASTTPPRREPSNQPDAPAVLSPMPLGSPGNPIDVADNEEDARIAGLTFEQLEEELRNVMAPENESLDSVSHV